MSMIDLSGQTQPDLKTERLILRALVLADVPEVWRWAGEFAVAATTLSLPHPYEAEMAEAWIAKQPAEFAGGSSVNYAITLQSKERLIGSIGLSCNSDANLAELSYWLGQPYWGNGYGTEAVRALVSYGIEELELNRIFDCTVGRNRASQRVREKANMRREGCMRQQVKRFGIVDDLVIYGMLKSDYVAQATS